jgi:hypothetical protein
MAEGTEKRMRDEELTVARMKAVGKNRYGKNETGLAAELPIRPVEFRWQLRNPDHGYGR